MSTSVIDQDALRRQQNLALQPPPAPMQLPGNQSPNLAIPPPPTVLNNYGKVADPSAMAPRGTLAGDKAERSRMEMAGPVSSQVYHRITDSGFGQNHPIAGKILGGIGQVASTLGDVGLSAVAPSVAINLPGTAYHHNMELNQLNRGIGSEEGEQEKEAQTQAQQATAGAENARTGLETAQTAQLPKTLNAELAGHGLQMDDQGHISPVSPENLSPEISAKLQGQWKPVAGAQGPNGSPLEYNESTGMYRTAQGVPGATVNPKNMAAKTLQLPNGQQVAGKTDSQGNLLLENGQPAPEGTKLYEAPNYAQQILPTKTATFIGPDGVPREYQWNEQTQTYDKPLGISASNAFGHEVAQAGAVQRGGEELIKDLQANRGNLGNLSAWVQKYGLDTPIADPTLAGLQAELKTFAALQPAMHGFRGGNALETFERIIGDLQKNPDATIASIRGILKTAGAINPDARNENSGKGVSLKAAMGLPQNKGKSEADVRKDIEAHGHTVTE